MLDMGFQKVGADFPVFLHPVTGDEFALARTERKVGVGYNGFETEFGTDVTLEDDLARRDLTINSMARLVVGWNELGHAKLSDDIVDPFGGQEDLRDGVLCHTTAAFAEDPLQCATLTPERVWAEVEKTMTEAHPELFFDTLNSLVHGGQFFPGLDTTFFRTNGLSVDERFLSLFAKAPLELLENLKAPTAVQRRVRKLQLVARDLLLAWGHPEQLLSLLKSVDAFRNRDDLVMVATVMDDALLMRAVDAASVVTFDSLSSEQQTTLRGKEVGDALDQLRLTALESA
jgi:tRNA nucleotidyltransferase/poly(A) polymerase